MDSEIVINEVLITAVMQALKMTEVDVRRAVQLGLSDVPLAEATPLYRAWQTYRFMQGCYDLLTDERGSAPDMTCAGNLLSNMPVEVWASFLDAHPDLLVRLFYRYEKGLPGIFQFGDIHIEYRPFVNGEALMLGRILV